MEKFKKDVKHFTDALFSTSPFKERKNDFNVRAIEMPSMDSGIDEPDKNLWRNTALGATFNTFGTARYVLTTANKAVRDVASAAPYDFMHILLNTNRYGGGGIFNLYATCMTGAERPDLLWQADYVFVHEFGHSFGGLGDEYYTSSTSYIDFYPKGVEPWEPNVTALLDKEHPKWEALTEKGTPAPTPWDKRMYDSLETARGKLDRTASDYYEKRGAILQAQRTLLEKQPYFGKVGYFEGAGYSSQGLYRPSVDCRMFTLSLADFDPVCRAAIERVIDFYAR
jgi:hypothetical protein